MTKSAALMAVLCVLVSAGCKDGRDDAYDKAMRRLVAEQKQLDWLDEKIKEIEVKSSIIDKDLSATMQRLAAVQPSDVKQKAEHSKLLGDLLRQSGELTLKTANDTLPWRKRRDGQLQRVEDARKAADEAK